MMSKCSSMYKRHRFPPEIIQHVVWLYHRFAISSRDIEDLYVRAWYCGQLRIVTDKLRSYGVAHRELIPDTTHDTSQYADNRAELSHQPTRARERGMRRFTSTHQAQWILNTHAVAVLAYQLSKRDDPLPNK